MSESWLRLLLRTLGGICVLAVIPLFVPRSWLVVGHQFLGLGEFPTAPIAEYLARSVSALCAFYGGLLILLARDVRGFVSIIRYQAAAIMALSAIGIFAGVRAGVPAFFVIADALGCWVFLLPILILAARVNQEWPQDMQPYHQPTTRGSDPLRAIADLEAVRPAMMPREDLPYCGCRWLERAAHDPECPIEFDPELNEYNVVFGRSTRLIYHCPFCAGRAPESLRAQMFATVSPEETSRLHLLTHDLKTEEEVLAELGEPTHVLEHGGTVVDAEKDGEPREIRTWKSLRYDNHSETATININVGRHGKVHILFHGKYIGKPKQA